MALSQNLSVNLSTRLVLAGQQRQSLEILQLSQCALEKKAEEMATENPFLEWEPLSPEDYWPEEGRRRSRVSFEGEDKEMQIKTPVSLQEELKKNIILEEDSLEKSCLIAEYLIDAMEEDGRLRTPLEDLAHDLSQRLNGELTLDQLYSILFSLQQMDPPGILSRSLEESILIQLSDRRELSVTWMKLLKNLPQLVTWGYESFAKKMGLSLDTLKIMLKKIRSLSLSPGSWMNSSASEPVWMDVFVRQNQEGRWECHLNTSSLPRISLNNLLIEKAQGSLAHGADQTYWKEKKAQALFFIKAIHQRGKTLRAVCQAIVEHQKLFFETGSFKFLKPLFLKDLASTLGVHESTISRAIHEKYMHTPFGIYPLKKFLNGSVQEEISVSFIKSQLKRFVEEEKIPLSDDQLKEEFQVIGIEIARRTISKYRESLNIPSSFLRKRYKNLSLG